jgi:type VI secretion system protein ImpG
LGDTAEIVFLFSRFERRERQPELERAIARNTFLLGCTPVVNLFPHTAEPITVDQTRHEYPLVPDVNRRDVFEVFSVEEVTGIEGQTRAVRTYHPLFSFTHQGEKPSDPTFWIANRHASTRKDDDGTEVSLSFVDLQEKPRQPAFQTIVARCLCTNRDFASRLAFGQDPAGRDGRKPLRITYDDPQSGDFQLEKAAAIDRVFTVRPPGPTLRPPFQSGRLWRLVSHLSLNYLSLVSEGRESLQEMLRLYNLSDERFLEEQIGGIIDVRSSPRFTRVPSQYGVVFARGTRVDMTLDEDQFVGSGMWLFASVLDRFLGQAVSLNSFSELAVTTPQRKGTVHRWPPRAGKKILV